MATEDLKYSAFYWHFNDHTKKREFYLDHHINIKKNGTYVLMRQDDWMGKPIYSNGFIYSSILNLIDTIFLKSKYKPDYTFDIERLAIYDGLTYCLDYKIDGRQNKEIQFIPSNSPDHLTSLGSILDTIISKAIQTNLDTIFLETYKERLIEISLPNLPPLSLPPPPIKKNQKRFNQSHYKH